MPFFVTLAGYLVIFFVEKIAFDTHSFIEEHHHHHHHHGNSDGKKAPAPAAPPAKLGNCGGSGVAVSNSGASAARICASIRPPIHPSTHPFALAVYQTHTTPCKRHSTQPNQ